MTRVRLLCVVEIDIYDSRRDPESAARKRLDTFRESVQPSANYGVCLYSLASASSRAEYAKLLTDGITIEKLPT